jgi:RNA polymerase sigma factor (sigma-70 family)
MIPTDHTRMVAVAAGDLALMSEIYQNRRRALFRFFFRLTGRQALAEDLVHEVFLRMIRYRHTYQKDDSGPDAFESWMYRIARNAWADHGRKHRSEVLAGEGEAEALESGRPSAFENLARQQDLALLYRALRELPEPQRELLVMARFQGLSYERIGEIVGCQTGTVKTRVFRAMKELSVVFSDLAKEKAS